FAAPALQGKGELQRIEKGNVKQAHEPVVARVIEVRERVQPRDALGRRGALRQQLGPELQQPRRGERLFFNAAQHVSQRIQIFVGFAQVGKNLFELMATLEHDAAIEQNQQQKRSP